MLIVVVTGWVSPEHVSCASIGALDWTTQVPGPWSGTSLVDPTDERSPTSAPLAAAISAEPAGGAIATVEVTDGSADLAVAVAPGTVGIVGVGVGVGDVEDVDLGVTDLVRVVVDSALVVGAAARKVVPRECAMDFGGLETIKTRTSNKIGLDHKTRCAARSDVTRRIMIPPYRRVRSAAKLDDVMAAHTRNR